MCTLTSYLADVGGDCDDADPAVNPGAAEVCDDADTDEDCSGFADNEDPGVTDATTWYGDDDRDGYGDDADVVALCDGAEGYAAAGTDCDDNDPEVGGILTWYADADGDGYGAGAGTASCTPIVDAATQGGDCDEGDGAINPGATEVCDDVDNDCDAAVDDADGSLDLSSASTWYPDDDGDGYGGDAASVQNCERPSTYLANGGDCDDADETISPDASEVCDNGVDDDCDDNATECRFADLTLGDSTTDAALEGSEEYETAGYFLAFTGDLNGDGTSDLIVGEPHANDLAGGVRVVYMPETGTFDLADAEAVYVGADVYDYVGIGVGGGDVDGDGVPELFFSQREAVLFAHGVPSSGTTDSLVDTTILQVEGDCLQPHSGDMDADGLEDLVVGCPETDGAGTDVGTVWVVNAAPASGELDIADVAFGISGTAASDGMWASALGDVDADGVKDLVVSGQRGDVAVFLGPITSDTDLAAADQGWTGPRSYGGVGDAGDVDGDGYADVLIGDAGFGTWPTDYGEVTLYPGVPGGLATDAADTFTLQGPPGLSYGGFKHTPAGDLDHDGYDDFVAGSLDDARQGYAWVVYGPVTADGDLMDYPTLTGGEVGDLTGCAVAAGDANGDGYNDLAISSAAADGGATGSGIVWLLYGTGI